MFRAQPVPSKLLSKKWHDRDFALHKEKIKQARATLKSTVAPQEHVHLRTKPKKTQMLEGKLLSSNALERYTEIERENRILLEKMTSILQNPKGISHANPSASVLPPINN
jgi:Hemingway/CFA97